MVQEGDQCTWMMLGVLGLKMLSLNVPLHILEMLVLTADHTWKMPLLSAHQVLHTLGMQEYMFVNKLVHNVFPSLLRDQYHM